MARAREVDAPECIAVVDSTFNLIAYARTDGAAFTALGISLAKANVAVSKAIDTQNLCRCSAEAQNDKHVASFANVGGGLPIIVCGLLLGAVGVCAGTVEQDVIVATAVRDVAQRALERFD